MDEHKTNVDNYLNTYSMNANQNENVESNTFDSNVTSNNDQDDDSSIEILQVVRNNENISIENMSFWKGKSNQKPNTIQDNERQWQGKGKKRTRIE